MARIFDNIEQDLLATLRATLQVSCRSDFCVGYLNLRGWQAIDDLITPWNPAVGQVRRVLVGMQRPPASCKETIDLIDEKVAQHFLLNSDELDAICTFDQKFRVGAVDD